MSEEHKSAFGSLAMRGLGFLRDFGERLFLGEKVEGIPAIIDGDTIEVKGTRIRIAGIDAPEFSQLAATDDGEQHPVGQLSANHLGALIAGREVSVRLRATDIYGRVVSKCFCGSDDLGAKMVENGWAVATGKNYRQEEGMAKASRAGLWKTDFGCPAEHRRDGPAAESQDHSRDITGAPAQRQPAVRLDAVRLIGSTEINGGVRGWIEDNGEKVSFIAFGKPASDFRALGAVSHFNLAGLKTDDGSLRLVAVSPVRLKKIARTAEAER